MDSGNEMYRVLDDICDDIKVGDEVIIIPSYGYMIGTNNMRIKDYFKLKSGEVVVGKNILLENSSIKSRMALSKCKKSSLAIIK